MSNAASLNECLTTYTWGRKYCVEVFASGKYYVSYKKGHVDISKEQYQTFMKLIKDIEPLDCKESFFGKVIELPVNQKVTRWIVRLISNYNRKETIKNTEMISNKQDLIYLGKGKYISKEDYNKVLIHHEASKYGETIDEGGS